tara:strand:+ start:70 stop:423 length:354 start_codon:yes stop_codon:yes gene_type:complete
MKRINIEVARTNSQVTVIARIKEQCAKKNKDIMFCTTGDIIAKLGEMEIAVGRCLQESTLCNTRPQTCVGTWIFENPVVPKKTARRKKQKKSHISLDKSSKNVIIEEEETEVNTNSE